MQHDLYFDIKDRYERFRVEPLGYATVADYCDSVDHIPMLSTLNHDLKDVQRAWTVKAILSQVPSGSSLLEIGAGDPWVAAFLANCGYLITIVDPYDGRDRGPHASNVSRDKYPGIKFYQGLFPDALEGLEDRFDCTYSISVLEHIHKSDIGRLATGLKEFSRDHNCRTIHSIDFIHQGRGSPESFENMKEWMYHLGFSSTSLTQIIASMSADPETYYLSAESHNMWRGGLRYEDYPMRRISSIQICTTCSNVSR